MLQHLNRLLRPMACIVALVLAALLVARPAPAASSYTLFESGQVRPLAISPDGTRLFAVNTPDNRLEIFTIAPGGLTHLESVPVGLEPVAVAARNNGEVWVVNHLSDSVSVVDVSGATARVRAHPARRRRAPRHRLRGTGWQPRLHHHRAPRAEHAAASHDRRRC